MKYQSTRDKTIEVTSAQAITQGISVDRGLFVPEEIPALSQDEIRDLCGMTYAERAHLILSKYLTDFTAGEVAECVGAAYTEQAFRSPDIAPLKKLDDTAYMLELWHGPTCAFKDMALQILPHLMRVSAGKVSENEEIVILVATSGDTGKAALEGFRDAPHTRIFVFYPDTGVSPMQKLQMATQEGQNVGVFAIRGNFDDAQNGVKAIFTDPETGRLLQQHGKRFSSANSINWGRLVPQIVYYVSAYCDMVKNGTLSLGEPMNVVVPTGNFGNILAAYYAKQMGIPIARLICASNRNRVLTDFFETGVYDRRRDFYVTSSPSMDILISSNLERLLFDLCGRDDAAVRGWMDQLVSTGTYTVSDDVKRKMDDLFVAGTCDEQETAETIANAFREHGYLLDTHSAVAVRVYQDYRARTGDTTPTVIASTANPYKFPASVLGALGETCPADDLACADALQAVTGVEMPAPLANLRGKQPRFTDVCTKEEMRGRILNALDIKA